MKSRKPYANEFKQEAVKLVLEQGMSASQVARDLDISVDTLHRWLHAAPAHRRSEQCTHIINRTRAALTRE